MCRGQQEDNLDKMERSLKWLQWFVFGLWVVLGAWNLWTEVSKFDYAAVLVLLLVYMLVERHWPAERVRTRKERAEWWGMWAKQMIAHHDMLAECYERIEQLAKERDALHAIVAKDGLCETCKHHGTCPLEGGPIEMDCVVCENEDCPCVGCTTKTDHWEWVGVKEEEHAGADESEKVL